VPCHDHRDQNARNIIIIADVTNAFETQVFLLILMTVYLLALY